MQHQHALWIERFSGRLGIPLWTSLLAYALAVIIVFVTTYFLAGTAEWNYFLNNFLLGVPFGLAPLTVLFLLLSVYIGRRMVSLEEYALSLVQNHQSVSDKIARLSSIKGIIIALVGLNAIIAPFYLFVQIPGASFLQSVSTQLPWLFVTWVISTLVWVWGYSMVGIYRIGKLPMKLRPFTEDKMLGLKPFASASLRFTAIYYTFVLAFIFVDLSSPPSSSPLLFVRDGALAAFGLVLFFLPLFSLHGKLVQARSERMTWINRRYTLLMEKIEANGDAPLGESVQRELSSIDKIQRDIQSIRPWPFDVNALTKLVAIFLTVTAILLSKVIGPVLGLK